MRIREPTCGINEEYSDCANGRCYGPQKCSEIGRPLICLRELSAGACRGGCVCKEGYLRIDNRVCMHQDQCPNRSVKKLKALCDDYPAGEIPDPKSGCCGIEASERDKIRSGKTVVLDQHPWIALIEYKKGDIKRQVCAGALISSRYVLTSAHCVVGPVLHAGVLISVRLGEYDTANDGPDCVEQPGGGKDCTAGAIDIPIEKTIVHPDYDPKSSQRRADIALIQLKEAAPYTDFIRPICLPTTDVTLSPPSPFPLHVVGWGIFSDSQVSLSNTKQGVQLPYQPIEICQQGYIQPRRNVTLWSGQICAGGDKDQKIFVAPSTSWYFCKFYE